MLTGRTLSFTRCVGVDEHTIEIAGSPVFYRQAEHVGDGDPVLFIHSVPTSSDDWVEMLPQAGGVAVDLPGFGRSGKGGQLDYSPAAYADFLERFLRMLELDRVAIVAHGWGAAFALMLAMARPARVSRLALVDAVPLIEGFAWPRPVRWWRPPVLGELVMGSINPWYMRRTLRRGGGSPDAWPAARLQAVWDQFDQGTQRALLRLHRSVDVGDLAAAGRGLEQVEVPVLIAWGEADPWLDPRFADAYAARLPDATVRRVAGAGHWPWLQDPALAAALIAFAAGDRA
jgi:pimeloyl-ACP methyl ester carboxylesterase